MRLAVRSRKNILVSGPTGSGKTTWTKALIREIPAEERLITIEDAQELVLDRHPESRAALLLQGRSGTGARDPKQLLESCLRMKPDRILLAELRAEEAFDYLRNVNSGHPGSITSVHAASAELAFEQLVLLVKQSRGGRELPRARHQELLYLLVDVVIQFGVERHERFIKEIWFDPERKRRGLADAALSRASGRLAQGGRASVVPHCVVAQLPRRVLFPVVAARGSASATPLTVARYGYYYGDRPPIRRRLSGLGARGLALVVLELALALLLPRRRALHGDARFATRREIAARGTSWAIDGIILGTLGPALPDARRPAGRALAAPPRAGKGTGVVVPNAPQLARLARLRRHQARELDASPPAFARDCGQACYLFDPFAEDGRTARWNPFFYVSTDPRATRERSAAHRRDALSRIRRTGSFLDRARPLALSWASRSISSRRPRCRRPSGRCCARAWRRDDEGFGQHWKRVIEGRNSGTCPLSSQCVRALYDVIDLAPVTASSIRKTFTVAAGSVAEPDPRCRDLRQ